jgi:hypothetical protein
MPSNPAPIVQQLQHEFPHLLAYVTGPDAGSQTAYTVALTVFRRLLALGAVLLWLFLVTRAAGGPAAPVTAPDGTRLSSHDQRPTPDYAVFGNGCVARPSVTARGQEGGSPLDAELSVPARCDADLLRDIIPAPESLGDTANARLGATHPPRLAWVRADLEPLLADQTDAVITALAVEANDPTCTMRHRQAVRRPVGYDQLNRT